MHGIEEKISSTSFLRRVQASVHPPPMAFCLCLVDVQHMDVLEGVWSERYILSSDWLRPICRPLSVVHGPAAVAGLVHEDHVGHPRGRDQV